jgi:hypothetical protein
MYIRAYPEPGYPARHLSGVWASGPFLHNGSVASVAELLKPARERAKMFYVGSSVIDTEDLGFESSFESVMPHIPDLEVKAQRLLNGDKGIISWMEATKNYLKGSSVSKPANIVEAKLQIACATYPERCFDVSHAGNSNQGHEGEDFGTFLSENDKLSVIEFLKILRPEPEYSHNSEPRYSAVRDPATKQVRCQTYQ